MEQPINTDHKTILIVESDYGLACMTAHALRPNHILLASSLKQAAEILEHSVVHVVVLDPDVPGESGIDFLLALATSHRDVRCVVYTMSHEVERLNGYGTAHAILLKPAREDRLRQAVLGKTSSGEFRQIRTGY